MISKSLLDELKTIIREDYGEELDDQKISQIGNSLVSYFDLLKEIHHRNRKPMEKEP